MIMAVIRPKFSPRKVVHRRAIDGKTIAKDAEILDMTRRPLMLPLLMSQSRRKQNARAAILLILRGRVDKRPI